MSNQAKKKTVSDGELREAGYMSADEFVDDLFQGLKEYFTKTGGFTISTNFIIQRI